MKTRREQSSPCRWRLLPLLLALPLAAPAGHAQLVGSDYMADEAVKSAYRAASVKETEYLKQQRRLAPLLHRRADLIKSLPYIHAKIHSARGKKVGQAASPRINHESLNKWTRELAAWESRLAEANVELEKIEALIDTIRHAGMNRDGSRDIILPGESVAVYVTEDESLNGLYQVRRGGYILLPRVGRIDIAGLRLPQAERAIREQLGMDQIRDATVVVERPDDSMWAPDSGVVYLTGEVEKTGPWQVVGMARPTLVTTLLRVGTTPAADLSRVRVMRLVQGQPLTEEVDVAAVLAGDALASDLELKESDIVLVPTREGANSIVYVSGNVKTPGVLKIPPNEDLTAYTAVLRMGGFGRFANEKKSFILREVGDGVKTRLPVNLRNVKKGVIPDVVLQSGDIVVVPERFFSF